MRIFENKKRPQSQLLLRLTFSWPPVLCNNLNQFHFSHGVALVTSNNNSHTQNLQWVIALL